MGGEWRERAVGELTLNFDGVRVPITERDRRLGPYPYYGASGVVDHVDGYLLDGEYLLVAEDGENLRTRTTPIAYLARGKFWVNNHAHIVRGNDEADTRFLMYALSATDISGYLTGSTMPKLTQGNMNQIRILAPPVREQRAIAHVLGTLDDKIEVNARLSDTLEATARALFKAWFVDFERSEDSEDRGAGTLADYVTLSAESWQKESHPEAIRYVDLSNTKFGRIESVAYHPRRDAPSRAQRVLRSGDTIVGTVRPGNGSYALISEEGLTGSTGFAVLRPRTETYREFVYLASTAAENIDRLSHLADGGAYPAVRPETVLDTRVVAASAEMIGAFSQLTRPLLARIAQSERESRALTVLRDALLPKLISGELRVRDAERFLERVL